MVISFSIFVRILIGVSALPLNVQDSLSVILGEKLSHSNSYYLEKGSDVDLNSFLVHKLVSKKFDIRDNIDSASNTIRIKSSFKTSQSTERTFLFTREYDVIEYHFDGFIVSNKESKVVNSFSQDFIFYPKRERKSYKLWKPVLISLITSTLIYSLWAID